MQQGRRAPVAPGGLEGGRHAASRAATKPEGARLAAYRTFVLAGIRDPLLIACMEDVEKEVVKSVDTYYGGLPKEVQINFYHYGKDAVMGPLEPTPVPGHEIGLMFEVIAPTQDMANAVCASVRSTYLHYGYKGRKSTAGNLAFPFAPSDVPFGAVYAFSVYHLMHIDDPLKYFPIEMREVAL